MKVVLRDGIEVEALYAVAAQNDVQLRRVAPKRDSLEDIFLKAMESEDSTNGRA